MGHLDLYHRTSPEAADEIQRTRRMTSKEHDGSVYFSTHQHGQGEGYGTAVVHVRVPEHLAELDDEFPDGEQHYRVNQRHLAPHHFVGARRTASFADSLEMHAKDLTERMGGVPTHMIEAHHPDHGKVGEMYWHSDDHTMGMGAGKPRKLMNPKGTIRNIIVPPEHKRRGVGTAMWNHARTITPELHHSMNQSEEGAAWAMKTAVRAGRLCEGCGGTGYVGPGEGCSACDESGRDPECPCGLPIELDPTDGWQHADGSISHDGRFHGHSVSDLVRMGSLRWALPTKRIFGPTFGLDHRLFDGEHLKADVTHYVLSTLDAFWRPVYGAGWQRWARVYLAGSEASEWTSKVLEGNNDFDVLIGVHYDRMRESLGGLIAMMTDEQITNALNTQFRESLMPRTSGDHPVMITIDGTPEGPFDQTWYCNPDSWDIVKIKPYAAYDITNHSWAVKPPHLPSWDISKFPEGHAMIEMGEAYEKLIAAIFDLPEPYRTQQGNALWTYLHTDRSRAFGPNGEGWYDPGNVMEKWLDQDGIWKDLWAIHHRAEEDPSTLLAPANWSNDPGAR